MNRFLLFVGDCYYPSGGWSDFVGSFPSLDAARSAAVEPECDCVSGWWFNIADLETGKIVAEEWGLESRWLAARRSEGPVEGALTGNEESLEVTGQRRSLKGVGI